MTITMYSVYVWDYGKEGRMPGGIQAWNASGVLVSDLTDYNMRFVGTTTLTIQSGTTTSWNVVYNGIRPTGWLAIPRMADSAQIFYCVCGTNSFSVNFLPTEGVTGRTITIDIYTFT